MKRVFVAMSGGVDSSVAAALLKKRGFSVVGVFMKPWSPYGANSKSEIRNPKQIQNSKFKIQNGDFCLWREDREDAMRVAAKLEIPLLTWDLSKEYEKRVVRYMLDGYKRGITPNPDVACNKFIKFGVFLEKALALGADYIATGHYARLRQRDANIRMHANDTNNFLQYSHVNSRHSHRYTLLKAKDPNKDQSYFLYALTQEQLKRCLFPIGDYKKSEVRRMAKKFGLPNWDKKDSQGVCFVGPLAMDKFLKKHIRPRKGKVVRQKDGQVLGGHDGVWYYTIGQRHGMNLSVGKPQYVVGKDVKRNILYVDDSSKFLISNSKFLNKSQIPNDKIQIKDFNWMNGEKKLLPLSCKVKTRYRQKDLDCAILKNGSDKALIEIKEGNTLVAPGQSAVFYKGDEVLGGGVIV